jgi:hypothetical protein
MLAASKVKISLADPATMSGMYRENRYRRFCHHPSQLRAYRFCSSTGHEVPVLTLGDIKRRCRPSRIIGRLMLR